MSFGGQTPTIIVLKEGEHSETSRQWRNANLAYERHGFIAREGANHK